MPLPAALVPALLTLATAALGLLAAAPAAAQAVIRADGSSTLFPLTEAVAREHQVRLRGLVRVPVEISGTRGGFRKFCRGETDLQSASRPILEDELAACRAAGIGFIELPIAYDALTIAVSARNDWARQISLDELRELWQRAAEGRIANWRQVNPDWPDRPIELLGAGADSGTLEYFVEAVVGEGGAIRRDYSGSEDDAFLAQRIASEPTALGFLPFAQALRNADRLRMLPVAMPAMSVPPAAAASSRPPAVMPSLDSVTSGRYQPFSRPLFVYVSERAAARREVREFVRFYIAEAPRLAADVGLVPLPGQAYALVTERFRQLRPGTAFGGRSAVGLSFAELVQREAAP